MNTPTATRQTAGSRAVRVPEPRTRDADRTQQAILQAATDEFSATGLGGARMENIAARAGVNKRLIYYYFGSKEDLFLAVLEDTYASIREAEKKLRLENLDPATGVRRLVEFTWDYYLANPHFLTLLNSENLHKAKHLNRSERIQEMNSPLVQLLSDLLQRGQQ
ncbi:MAG: TetR/AcrR family transcriptional regulator, partial [Gammaproteobacteria bacterium]|nr:TetR/AcrR family transcriptional regulator [Gammaproteobacteria bacterium]